MKKKKLMQAIVECPTISPKVKVEAILALRTLKFEESAREERLAYSTLDLAFAWVKTPQGHLFWDDIHSYLMKWEDKK